MRCSVQNCSNDTKKNNKSQGISFHLFPRDPKLRAAWVQALDLSQWVPTDRSTVCSEHFRSEDFYQTKTGMRKIKNGVLPVVCQDSSEDLDAPAALRVCRICLDTDTKMSDIHEDKLNQQFEQLTGIYLGIEDRQSTPQKVCWECAHRLKSATAFKNKAMRAHSILADLAQSKTFITLRDIKSVNRSYNNLISTLIQRIYDSNDYDVEIKDIKSENSRNEFEDDNASTGYNENGEDKDNVYNENGEDKDNVYNENGIDKLNNHNGKGYNENGDKEQSFPFMQVEVKDESTNDLYIDEFVNDFESDDDKKLSELNNDSNVEERKKSKIKKKKVKKREVKEVAEEEYGPTTVLDKYKTNEIKRRKNDGPDENLFTITSLTYDEQIAEIEKRQEGSLYRNAPYKCAACYRGFQLRERYDAHVLRHSEQSGAYECFICKTRLKTGRALRKHLTAQHTEKFSCKGCPFVTRNRGVAREHEKWHSGTKYQCPHCPSTFEKLTTYMGHIRIKHVSDFVCSLCGYTFVSQKGIEVHQKKKHRLHDNGIELTGPFCEICNVKFVSEEAHTRHLKLSSKHSSDSDPNRIRNDSQSMRTESSGRVMRKIERRPLVHTRDGEIEEQAGNGPVTCEQCGIQLRDLRLYAQHFRRAHPDKNRTKYPAMKTPCMCEQCGRIFQSMALLKDHMWVHTGEKRFKCTHCPKSFTQKTNLVFHERVHSASRPSYECPLCGKHFAFFNNRRRHMFIHTGLKPYKCDTCGKCFTTAGEQRAHVDHVHLKKPWPRRQRRHDGREGSVLEA